MHEDQSKNETKDMSPKAVIQHEKKKRDDKIKLKIKTVCKQIEDGAIPRFKRELMKSEEELARVLSAAKARGMSPPPPHS